MSESTTIVLSQCGLDQFIGKFLNEDINTKNDLMDLTDENMKELGLSIGQRNRLKRQLGTNNNNNTGRTSTTPQVASLVWSSGSNSDDDVPTIEEREQYQKVFEAMDKDGNGDVDMEEFTEALKKLDLFTSQIEAMRIFKIGDKDHGGTLDLEEFIELMHKAKRGYAGVELGKLAAAGEDVLKKLSSSSGFSITLDDIIDAEVTAKAIEEVQNLQNDDRFRWMPSTSECTKQSCTFIFNLLVIDLELVSKMLSVVCLAMLRELEEKLGEIGVNGFVSQVVNINAVERDALRLFAILSHRYSHDSHLTKDRIQQSDLEHIHSLRKAMTIAAANASVQDVRDAAVKMLEEAASKSGGERVSSGGELLAYSFAANAGQGFGESVGEAIGMEIAASVCTIQ